MDNYIYISKYIVTYITKNQTYTYILYNLRLLLN